MCANAGGPTETFSLSTATGYAAVTTLCAVRAMGNKVVMGMLLLAMTGAATFTVQIQVSYDDRRTWVDFGTPVNATAAGPFQVPATGLDAPWVRAKLSLSGTTQFCAGTATYNMSCQ